MKNVIITGATGLVGGLVLQECLDSTEIQSVTSITRRVSGNIHPKLTEIIHSDFTDYSAIYEHLKGKDIAFYCISIYTGKVPNSEFKKITVDYTAAFSKALKKESPNATFCFLSGQGADQTEKSPLIFAKSKGAAEKDLISRQFKELYIFRPGYIYPITRSFEPNFSYRLSQKLFPFLRLLMPNAVITSIRLAKAIFKIGLYGANQTILENIDIRMIEIEGLPR